MKPPFSPTRRLCVRLALAGSCAPGALYAQAPPAAESAPPEAPVSGVLREVLFEPLLQGEDPLRVLGLHPGQPMNPELARAALRRALDTGTFSEARVALRSVGGDGVVLRIDGERRVRVRELVFSGHDRRTLDAVRTDFAIAEGRFVTERELAAGIERVRQGYAAAGFAHAEVRSEWRYTDDPAVRLLLVTVREGAPVRLRRIVVSGLPPELAETVRNSCGASPGDLAALDLADRVILAAPVELRRANYLSAIATSVRLGPAPGDTADLVIDVRPGPLYRMEWVGVRAFPVPEVEASLRLEDERRFETTLLPTLSTRVRDFYVRRGFLDARARVEQTVSADGRTALLRFTVVENPRILVGTLEFPGARALSADRLGDVLREVLQEELPGGQFFQEPGEGVEDLFDGSVSAVGSRRPSVRVALDREHTYVAELYAEATRRMVRRYHDEGYLSAVVEPPVLTRYRDPDNRMALRVRFTVTEGPRASVDEVRFEGNAAVVSAVLARASELRVGVPLSNAELERARLRLLEYYRNHAYLFARVDPQLDRSPDGGHVRVRVVVREGPAVRVGQLVIRGNNRTLPGIIRARVRLLPGALFLPANARETQRLLGEMGIFASVNVGPVEPEIEAPVKDVLVQLQEQTPQFLELRAGLSTGEGLRVALEYGYRNLAGVGINANLGAAIGYQIPELTFDANYIAALRSLPPPGPVRYRVTASLQAPIITSLLRANFDFGAARTIERQFIIDSVTASVSANVRPVRQLTINTAADLQFNSLSLLNGSNINAYLGELVSQYLTQMTNPRYCYADPSMDPAAQLVLLNAYCGLPNATVQSTDIDRLRRLLLLPQGDTLLAALRVGLALDLRDQAFNPTRGIYATTTLEYVATLAYRPPTSTGSVDTTSGRPGNTMRVLASLTGYIPIPFGGIVVASNVRVGFNFPLDAPNVTYPNRQFFLGGTDSIRGWLQDTFLPQEVVDDARTASGNSNAGCNFDPFAAYQNPLSTVQLTQRGGDAMFLWRNEVRIPVGSTGLAVAVFADMGNLWKRVQDFNPFRVRASAGAGVRYQTPIGPIALDYGFNLCQRRDVGELPGALHFSIGVF